MKDTDKAQISENAAPERTGGAGPAETGEQPGMPATPGADAAEVLEPAGQVTKIVIWLRQSISTIGIQRTGSDPEFRSIPSGELRQVLDATPQAVQDAMAKWESNPRQKPARTAAQNAPPSRTQPANNKKAAGEAQKPRLL